MRRQLAAHGSATDNVRSDHRLEKGTFRHGALGNMAAVPQGDGPPDDETRATFFVRTGTDKVVAEVCWCCFCGCFFQGTNSECACACDAGYARATVACLWIQDALVDDAFKDGTGFQKSVFGDWSAVQPDVEVKERTVKAVMKKMKRDIEGGNPAARAALQNLFDQYDRNGDGSLTMDGINSFCFLSHKMVVDHIMCRVRDTIVNFRLRVHITHTYQHVVS